MKTLGNILLWVCLLMANNGIIAQTHVVSYDISDSVDFSSYHTFSFYQIDVQNKDKFKGKEDRLDILKKYIISEMKNRGFTYVEKDGELYINIGISAEEKVQTRETNITDPGRVPYMGQRTYHWESEEVVVNRYDEGTVVLDMVDAKNQMLIWQGVGTGTLTEKEKKSAKNIQNGIKKIFKRFPIKPTA